MSTSTLKQRHYAALSSRLRTLRSNLSESELQLDAMAHQLQAMSRLGINCGAQFMAVSRLLDEELSTAADKVSGSDVDSGTGAETRR